MNEVWRNSAEERRTTGLVKQEHEVRFYMRVLVDETSKRKNKRTFSMQIKLLRSVLILA